MDKETIREITAEIEALLRQPGVPDSVSVAASGMLSRIRQAANGEAEEVTDNPSSPDAVSLAADEEDEKPKRTRS